MTLAEARAEQKKLHAKLRHADSTLEGLVQARKRAHAIVARLGKEPSAGERELIQALRRDIQGFTHRIANIRARRKKDETRLQRVRKWLNRHRSKDGTLVMFDSIDIGQIPRDRKYAAAGYTSGLWPTWEQIRVGPWRRKLSINVSPGHDGRCDDVEPGDFSNDEAAQSSNRGKYTSVANLASLWNTIKAHGKDPSKLVYVTAHYDGHEHICSPGCGFGLTPEMVRAIKGTQWTDQAQGKNLDQSLCRLDLFK